MISPSDRSPPIQTSPCACLWFDCDGMRAKWGNIMPIMQVIPLCDLWFWMASKFAIFCNGIASSLYQLYPKRSRQNESNIGVWSNMVPSWIICTMGQSPGRQVGRGGTQWDLKSTNIFVFFQVSANFCQLFMSIFEKSLLWSFVSFFISFLVLQGERQRFLDVLLLRLERRMGVHRMAGWLRCLGTPKRHRQSSHVAVQIQHKPIAIHGSKSGRW